MSSNESQPKGKSMFQKFWLDVILGVIFVFAFMWGISKFAGAGIFEVFDPVGEALGDIEMSDISFSHMQDTAVADTNVVMVNIAYRSRYEIGIMLDSINKYEPAAVGMDILFYYPKDSLGDAKLSESLYNTKNLVMAAKFIPHPDDPTQDYFETSWPYFVPENAHLGMVTLDTEAASQNDLKLCRNLFPKISDGDGNEVWAFGAKLASFLEPEKAQKFIENSDTAEVINYKRNVFDNGSTAYGTLFPGEGLYHAIADTTALYSFNRTYLPSMVKGKIVIFCFLGTEIGDQISLEDKFFTPLNKKYAGRAFPDMFGGVIHANIVSMILEEDYITELPEYQTIIIILLVAFLNVMIFSWVYKKIPRWYDGTTKLIQAMEVLGLTFLMIIIFDKYHLKVDLTVTLVFVALVGDLLEVYFGVFKNIFTREGRKELFRVSKI